MKATNLELTPEAMLQMGESAVKAVVEHIINLPSAPRSNLENSAEIVRSLREPSPEKGTDFESLLYFFMNKVIPVSINTPHPASGRQLLLFSLSTGYCGNFPGQMQYNRPQSEGRFP